MRLTTELQNTLGKKLLELQGEIDESTTIVGDFNIPLSKTEKYSR